MLWTVRSGRAQVTPRIVAMCTARVGRRTGAVPTEAGIVREVDEGRRRCVGANQDLVAISTRVRT